VAAARRDAGRLALARQELGLPSTYTDWRAMLDQEKLDAVVVCTPHNYHVEPTVTALEHGLHVLLEKPLAASVAEAQAILQATNQSDRVVTMGVNLRGDPSWQTAQRLLAGGEIGRLRQITASLYGDLRIFREALPFTPRMQQDLDSSSEMFRTFLLDIIKPGAWRRDSQQMGGDMLSDIGAHQLDLLLWLGGAPAVEVLAYAPSARSPGAAIYTLQALLANEVILSLTFNDDVALGDDFDFRGASHLTIFGDRGVLTAKTSGWGPGSAENLVIERSGGRQVVAVEGERTVPATAFVATICDGAPNFATVADAVNVVTLTQAAYRSAAERRIVRLDESL
jgi:predicted dehydrogenase